MGGGLIIADPERKVAFVFLTSGAYSGWDVDKVVRKIVPALNLVMENNYNFEIQLKQDKPAPISLNLDEVGRATSVWFLLAELKTEMDACDFSDTMMFAGLAYQATQLGYEVWEYSEEIRRQLKDEGYQIIEVL